MTLEEYLNFLDEYWSLFPEPPPPPPKKEYKTILI